MALTVTSLASACTANDTKVTLTSAAGCVVGSLIMADGEFMLVTDVSTTPTVQVVRGYNNGAVSSNAVAHAALAPVTFGLTSEFGQTSALANSQIVSATSYSANGTITNPTVNATIFIDKATACALTLNDPAADQTNTVIIKSLTAAAHTVTYATGFYGDTTSSDVATFAAKAGASMTIVARNGKWTPLALANVTLA
jgi:hypothetical protein